MIPLKQLALIAPNLDEVRIHSFEMGIYLVEVVANGQSNYLCDDTHHVQRFRSLIQIRAALRATQVKRAVLVHSSPYNEMIGLSSESVAPLQIDLHWNSMDEHLGVH